MAAIAAMTKRISWIRFLTALSLSWQRRKPSAWGAFPLFQEMRPYLFLGMKAQTSADMKNKCKRYRDPHTDESGQPSLHQDDYIEIMREIADLVPNHQPVTAPDPMVTRDGL
jgi:hypothetical protein